MKTILLLVLLINVIGCTEPTNEHENKGGDITIDGGSQSGNVTVEGNIINTALVWNNYLPNLFKNAFAEGVISTRSTLIVADPERLNDVSLSAGVQVDANIINTQSSTISGYKIDVLVEDENFLTKESWSCNVCYATTGGTECESLYRIEGNNLFETDDAPTLPVCNENTATPALCVTQFNNNPDCANPIYQVDYEPAGDGLWKATIANISVDALSSLINSVGVQNSGWVTGSNKYARFTVYDEFSLQVTQKDYVFNVIN